MKSRGFQRQIILDTESCPSWPKEHDWKSCSASTSTRGFESLALRQKRRYESTVFYFCARDSNQKWERTASKARQGATEKQSGGLFQHFSKGAKRQRENPLLSAKKDGTKVPSFIFLRKGFEPEMGANGEQSETRSDRETVRGTVSTFLQRSKATARKSLALRQKRRYESTAFIFSRTMCLPVALVSLI